jgi:hypothetical protein
MKHTSLIAIRSAFKTELTELQTISPLPQEGHWEYARNPGGGWSGQFVAKPSFRGLFSMYDFAKLTAGIEAAFKQDYPEYLQIVGTSLLAGVFQLAGALQSLALEAHKRFGSFALTDAQIETILADVSTFFDRQTVRFRLYAPALNLRGPQETPSMAFPGGIVLRPITDEECTQFYGGNPIFQMGKQTVGFPDFVFVKDIEIPKIFSYDEMKEDPVFGLFQEELNLCMLALASFKDAGAVGYDGVHIVPSELTLGPGFSRHHLWGNDHVPIGLYGVTPEEAPKIEGHAQMFKHIHATLEMATQRLVDSARRTKLRDTIVDAVIGLESILLANTGDRTELRFRFA